MRVTGLTHASGMSKRGHRERVSSTQESTIQAGIQDVACYRLAGQLSSSSTIINTG